MVRDELLGFLMATGSLITRLQKSIFFSFRIACKLKITLFGHKFLCPQEQFDFHKSKNQ